MRVLFLIPAQKWKSYPIININTQQCGYYFNTRANGKDTLKGPKSLDKKLGWGHTYAGIIFNTHVIRG